MPACSSNGLLRWFLGLMDGALERAIAEGGFKVRTGHYGMLVLSLRTAAGASRRVERPPSRPSPRPWSSL